MKQLKMSLRSADDEKRSAPIFSGLNSRFNLQGITDDLYKRSGDEIEAVDKRSAALFNRLNSKAQYGKFISGLYKRSAPIWAGLNTRLKNADLIDNLYRKRGDNYA